MFKSCVKAVRWMTLVLLAVYCLLGPNPISAPPLYAQPTEKPDDQTLDAQSTTAHVGLLPVDFAPLPGTQDKAAKLESRLVKALSEHPGTALIGPKRMGRWTHTMRMSQIDRKELQAGVIAGAQLLVVPRLVHRGDGYLTHVTLIDTATGQTLWEHARQDTDEQPLAVMLDRLLHAVDNAPKRATDDQIDLALLVPDDTHGWTRKQNWRAEATQARWSAALAAADARVRILDRHLADFVSRGSILERAGLVDPDREVELVHSPIVVQTRIDSPYNSRYAFEDAPYALKLTVHDGDWQTQIKVKGTLEHAASIEADALNQLLAVITQRRGLEPPEKIQAVGDAAYWQARALMYEAQTSAALEFDGLYDKLKTPDGIELASNVVAAVKALPGSKEPLAPLGEVSDENGIYITGMPGDKPFGDLKKLLLKHYIDSPMSGRAVMAQTRQVYDYSKRELKQDKPELLKRMLAMAQQSAEAALLNHEVPHPTLIRFLVHVDEGQLALDAALARAWRRKSLGDWQTISQVVTEAIDTGQMDLAYRGYQAQMTLFPDYYAEGNMRHNTRLGKLQEDDAKNDDRWSKLVPGLLEGKGRLDKADREAKQTVADYYQSMADQERWEQIAREALEDIRTDPPRISTSTNYTYAPFNSYLMAIQNLLEPQAYEQRLVELAYGDLPEVKGGWDANVQMRSNAWSLRFEALEHLARFWVGQRRFKDVLNHPLIGTKVWYHGNGGSEWELYLYAGQPERAIQYVESDYELTKAYLYTGRFEEAAKYPLKKRWGEAIACAKAALLTRDQTAFERAVKFVDKNTDGPLPLLIQYLQLQMKDIETIDAWANGYEAEFMGDTDRAIKTYQQGVLDHPNTFAAAEAMFRVGELLLLDKGIKDKAQFWFSESMITYEKIIDRTRDQSIQAWCRYRIGQVAYLTQDDADTAKQAWEKGAKGDGPGKKLCGWALHSLDTSDPTTRVGNSPDPAASRLVEIDLDDGNLHVVLDKKYLNSKINSHIYGPLGLDYKLFEAWTDDQEDKWWSVYLWYRYADIRPGFALVYTETPDATEAVWCRIRREKE